MKATLKYNLAAIDGEAFYDTDKLYQRVLPFIALDICMYTCSSLHTQALASRCMFIRTFKFADKHGAGKGEDKIEQRDKQPDLNGQIGRGH